MENLVLLCGFHHRLVHELGWRLRVERGCEIAWYRPDGRRYLAGPAPPRPGEREDGRDAVGAGREGTLVGV
jgi:hypothetical protein